MLAIRLGFSTNAECPSGQLRSGRSARSPEANPAPQLLKCRLPARDQTAGSRHDTREGCR